MHQTQTPGEPIPAPPVTDFDDPSEYQRAMLRIMRERPRSPIVRTDSHRPIAIIATEARNG